MQANWSRLADIVAKRLFALRRATLIQEIDMPRKIDSSGAPVGFDSCALGGGHRLLQQNRHLASVWTRALNGRYWGKSRHDAGIAADNLTNKWRYDPIAPFWN